MNHTVPETVARLAGGSRLSGNHTVPKCPEYGVQFVEAPSLPQCVSVLWLVCYHLCIPKDIVSSPQALFFLPFTVQQGGPGTVLAAQVLLSG